MRHFSRSSGCSLDAAVGWEKKGSYHTAWSVPCNSSCTCSCAYGQGPAIGPQTGKRCWPLLAIAPLMKPWCAEGDVPTAANLNLYWGWKSFVGWHRDDEPLFGKCGDAKLIVSVSLGGSAVFRWKRRSCPNDDGHLCCLGHGDILVMDGRCQDKFLHRTDPCREQERIKHYVPLDQTACFLLSCVQGRSSVLFANLCAGFTSSCHGECCFWRFFGFLVSSWCLVRMENTSKASLPVWDFLWDSIWEQYLLGYFC